MTTKKKRNTLDDVDLKPLEVYTLFDSVLPTDTGVYAIVNKLDRRFYLGSARSAGKFPSARGFKRRFANKNGHRQQLLDGKHHCRFLQRAYNAVVKQGLNPNDLFEIWIVEHVERDRCLEVEDWYLKFYRPTYNGVLTARGVTDGEYTPSAETRRKISISSTGRIKSPETCAKLSAAHKGKKKSAKHVENLSIAKSENYVGISPSGEVFRFKGAQRFADQHNLIKSCILKCSRGIHHIHKRWLFFRQDDPVLTDDYIQELVLSQKSKYRLHVAVSPTGDIYEFYDSKEFAREHKLKTAKVNECAAGKKYSYKKWHIYYVDDPRATKDYIKELSESKRIKALFPGTYLAISPTGELIYFDSLVAFANEHDLCSSNISGCLQGYAKQHLCWKFYYSDDQRLTKDFIQTEINNQPNLIRYEYVGISPQGDVFYFDNAAKFVKSRDGEITKHGVSNCAKGYLETHAGWRFYFLQNTTPEFINEMVELQSKPNYVALSPKGEVFFFKSPTAFAKDHPVTSQGLTQCANGRLQTHRGWKCIFYDDYIDIAA
jgi:group I intron endonuclease